MTLIDHLKTNVKFINALYGATTAESLAWQVLKFEANRLLWNNYMPNRYYANDVQIRNWLEIFGTGCDMLKETIDYIVEFRKNLQLEDKN